MLGLKPLKENRSATHCPPHSQHGKEIPSPLTAPSVTTISSIFVFATIRIRSTTTLSRSPARCSIRYLSIARRARHESTRSFSACRDAVETRRQPHRSQRGHGQNFYHHWRVPAV